MHRYLLNSFRNIKIGQNNTISKSVKIHENVIIGNNNKIYDDVIIYPNTIIGDNNIILNNNIIGEYPVQSSDKYRDYNFDKIYGTKIGNNNFLHVRNIIFGGVERKTEIKNNNKILAECHISHDSIVHNNVTLYLRVIMGGFSECLDNSNIGGYAFIQQRKIIGQYSMVGGSQLVAKNVFPYFIFIKGKITRLNNIKLSDNIIKYENELKKLTEEYYKGNTNLILDKLPDKIRLDIELFLDKSKIN
jgi:acyl-[acyl carrier protein]--UDP-N-acetylglucosamine O-acyltransferase